RGVARQGDNHARRRAKNRAGAILPDRIAAGADDEGADRGQIHHLRHDGDQAGCRKEGSCHAEHAGSAEILRRFLAAALEGLRSLRQAPRVAKTVPTSVQLPKPGSSELVASPLLLKLTRYGRTGYPVSVRIPFAS